LNDRVFTVKVSAFMPTVRAVRVIVACLVVLTLGPACGADGGADNEDSGGSAGSGVGGAAAGRGGSSGSGETGGTGGEAAQGGCAASNGGSTETVELDDGVIPRLAREAFCVEVATATDVVYDECIRLAKDTATVLFTLPACSADENLLAAINCALGAGVCAAECVTAFEAWQTSLSDADCEPRINSIGAGDAVPEGGSDSWCDRGVRAAGGWCSRPCGSSTDTTTCSGSGAGALNHFGTPNVCAPETFMGGFGCYPSCTSTVDCQNWFGDMAFGSPIVCRSFSTSVAALPICVRVDGTTPSGMDLP
jgi:hypothetical protein